MKKLGDLYAAAPTRKRARNSPTAAVSSAAPAPRLTVAGSDATGRWAALANLWREGTLLDCSVTVDGRDFAAHRVVLAACSLYMKSAFSLGFAETATSKIVLEELSHAAFEALLTWSYDGWVTIPEPLLPDLLIAAARLQMAELLEACEELVIERLSPADCLQMWELGDSFMRPRIVEVARAAANASFPQVAEAASFERLPAAWLEELLASDGLGAKDEASVFTSLERWHAAQSPAPEADVLARLLGCVRWAWLDQTFLQEHATASPLLEQRGHLMIMTKAIVEAMHGPKPKPRNRFELELKCTFASAFDTNGVLYHLATDGGKQPYTNPHEGCLVVATMSSVVNCMMGPRQFVQHVFDQAVYNHTDSYPNSWMAVDLGEGRLLIPDYYCLRSDQLRQIKVRNWQLQGSNDGIAWTVLRSHVDDESLGREHMSTAAWPITGCSEAFRHFRVLQTGLNSIGHHGLPCTGIELYGQFYWRVLH